MKPRSFQKKKDEDKNFEHNSDTNHTRWRMMRGHHARTPTLYRNLCKYMPGFAYALLSPRLKVSIRTYFVTIFMLYSVCRLSDVRTARLIDGRYRAFPGTMLSSGQAWQKICAGAGSDTWSKRRWNQEGLQIATTDLPSRQEPRSWKRSICEVPKHLW